MQLVAQVVLENVKGRKGFGAIHVVSTLFKEEDSAYEICCNRHRDDWTQQVQR